MTTTSAPPELHTLAEVAARFGLSLRLLQRRARTEPPAFTHIEIGKQRYLTDDMVTALLATFTRSTSASKPVTKRDADLAKVADRLARRGPGRRRKPAA